MGRGLVCLGVAKVTWHFEKKFRPLRIRFFFPVERSFFRFEHWIFDRNRLGLDFLNFFFEKKIPPTNVICNFINRHLWFPWVSDGFLALNREISKSFFSSICKGKSKVPMEQLKRLHSYNGRNCRVQFVLSNFKQCHSQLSLSQINEWYQCFVVVLDGPWMEVSSWAPCV